MKAIDLKGRGEKTFIVRTAEEEYRIHGARMVVTVSQDVEITDQVGKPLFLSYRGSWLTAWEVTLPMCG